MERLKTQENEVIVDETRPLKKQRRWGSKALEEGSSFNRWKCIKIGSISEAKRLREGGGESDIVLNIIVLILAK